jgi:hypothetical protein
MKPLVINEEATEELTEAISYYETRKRGLGVDLAAKVREAFLRIQKNPGFYPHHNQTHIQNTSSAGFTTPSSTLSLMITSPSLRSLIRGDSLITGDSEDRNEAAGIVSG